MIGDYDSSHIEYYNENLNSIKNETRFHKKSITFLKYMPNNGYVASGSSDSTVHIWDPKTFEPIQIYTGHKKNVLGRDQIDNDTMVTGSFDKTIQIWKISTGETSKIINVDELVYAVKVLLNELQQIVCSTNGTSNNLLIYDYTTGNLVQALNGHTDTVASVEVLNDQFIASGSSDASIIIWDLNTYTPKYTLNDRVGVILYLKRLSDNLLASTGSLSHILIWNWLTGELVHRLDGHTDALRFCSLDLYDKDTLISGSMDQTIRFWNISNGTLIRKINTGIRIHALAMLKEIGDALYFYYQ